MAHDSSQMNQAKKNTPVLPKTQIPYTFLQAGHRGRYSDIFYTSTPTPANDMASVNAGDPGLYVGGGTINDRFSQEIDQPGNYQMIHARALMGARQGQSVFHPSPSDPAQLVLVVRSSHDGTRGAVAAGTVFLSVFGARKRPFGVTQNAAMIYAIPPLGSDYPDLASFCQAITATAQNIATAVTQFNAAVLAGTDAAYKGLGVLQVVRSCLFSGGQFIQAGASKDDVAKAIFDGFSTAFAQDSTGVVALEFESATGEFAALPT